MSERVLHQEGGGIDRIRVITTTDPWTGRPTLELMIGDQRAASVFRDDGKPAYRYMQQMGMYERLVPQMSNALVIGGGGGVLAEHIYSHSSAQIDVLEIDPRLEAVARKYFALPKSERITWHTGPAEETLPTLPAKHYQLALVDIFTTNPDSHALEHASVINDSSIVPMIDRVVQPGGVVIYNTVGVLGDPRGIPRTLMNQLRTNWEFQAVWLVNHPGSPELSQNVVIAVANQPLRPWLLRNGGTMFIPWFQQGN